MDNNRDFWFDNAKAILITLVVIGHLATSVMTFEPEWVEVVGKFIYFFHMPVFMMISGRFSAGRIHRGEYAKTFSYLLLPYFYMYIGMIFTYYALGIHVNFDPLVPKFGCWYFLALFFHIIATILLKKFRFLFIGSVLLSIIVFLLPYTLYGVFFRAIMFYPFFLFGYYTSSYSFSFCKRAWFRFLSILFFITLFWIIFKKESHIPLDLLYLADSIGQIEGTRLLEKQILHILVCFLCFFAFLGICPAQKTFFTYIGTHSVYVYALHLFPVQILRNIWPAIPTENTFGVCLLLLGGVLLSFLLASPPVRYLFHFFFEPNKRVIEKLQKLFHEHP